MTISLFLGRFFGIYLIIIGFFYLCRRDQLQRIAEQIFEQEALRLLSAVMSLMIGLLIVIGHNVWEWSWPLTITLLGYLTLLKGLTRLFVPPNKFFLKLIQGDNPIYIGMLCLILGFFLTYESFFSTL